MSELKITIGLLIIATHIPANSFPHFLAMIRSRTLVTLKVPSTETSLRPLSYLPVLQCIPTSARRGDRSTPYSGLKEASKWIGQHVSVLGLRLIKEILHWWSSIESSIDLGLIYMLLLYCNSTSNEQANKETESQRKVY